MPSCSYTLLSIYDDDVSPIGVPAVLFLVFRPLMESEKCEIFVSSGLLQAASTLPVEVQEWLEGTLADLYTGYAVDRVSGTALLATYGDSSVGPLRETQQDLIAANTFSDFIILDKSKDLLGTHDRSISWVPFDIACVRAFEALSRHSANMQEV